MKSSKTILCLVIAGALTVSAHSIANDSDVQDMSDPLAVYTQAGLGYTDKGLNLKVGQTYDTGSESTMGMNVLEVKGFAGDAIGWNGRGADDSIDALRYRNFNVDMTNGRGAQVDVNLGFTDIGTQGTASYSLIQALPKMGPLNLYPLAGVGVAFGETLDGSGAGEAQAQDRWDLHGTFYVAGLYSKLEITENIWLNYNPMYTGTMSGSDTFKNHGMDNDDSVLLHEAALSYQINPRTNVRYFANWTENTNYANGDHRIEVNYQF
ncbi:hypothetical protein KP803_21675 [Vibrio sp. ZSDE26]|uniref:Porin n=1 Tax=Vibrio amylolyticus TaxID=2847292 RepID=A0A9X1XNK3_9VIBR|nr:hypothetical protein [Vibrio amylolyticus]MCK6265871.1 hypothetical protein [Vibrio amylolyticus]